MYALWWCILFVYKKALQYNYIPDFQSWMIDRSDDFLFCFYCTMFWVGLLFHNWYPITTVPLMDALFYSGLGWLLDQCKVYLNSFNVLKG